MKLEQYGYCSNNAQFQANINISNVFEYRQCYEGCKTHGYNHIAVSTSGECKCVESSCAEDTYSLIDAGYCVDSIATGYSSKYSLDLEGCFQQCLQSEYDFFIQHGTSNCYCGHSKENAQLVSEDHQCASGDLGSSGGFASLEACIQQGQSDGATHISYKNGWCMRSSVCPQTPNAGYMIYKLECSSWTTDTSYSSYRLTRVSTGDYAWATYSPLDDASPP